MAPQAGDTRELCTAEVAGGFRPVPPECRGDFPSPESLPVQRRETAGCAGGKGAKSSGPRFTWLRQEAGNKGHKCGVESPRSLAGRGFTALSTESCTQAAGCGGQRGLPGEAHRMG